MGLDKYTYVYESDSISYHHDHEMACMPELQYPCSQEELEMLETLDKLVELRQDILERIHKRGVICEI